MKRFAHFITQPHFSILCIVFLALILRIPLLNGSFWLDEAAQALESVRPLSQQLNIAKDFQPPLLHVLIHFAAYFSHSEWWLRTIGALIPGLFSIYFFYKATEKLFSRHTATISTLLLATSSFHIFYSQELRPYSLAALWATVSWYLLIKESAGTEKNSNRFSRKNLLLFVIVTTLGMYSTYLYPFVVLSQVIYIAIAEKKQLTTVLLGLLVVAFLFAPWVPSVLEQLRVGQLLRIELPGWEAVVSIPQLKSLPLAFGKFIFGVLNIEINSVFILTTGIITGLLGFFAWQKGMSFFLSKKMMLVFCWLLIPLITSWLVSFWIPILQPKRVLYILPAWFLLLTAIAIEGNLFQKKFTQLKKKSLVFLILLFFCNIFSTFQYYTNPLYQRENWRDIHTKIVTQYPNNTAVIFGFPEAFAPWVWYDDGNFPTFSTGMYSPENPSGVQNELKKASEYPYLLVFDYLRDLTDPGHTIETELQNLGYSEKDIFSAPNIGFVRVYARRTAVLSAR